ncbi:MAG: RluA family pseudouridine synthase [Massiliimalia sp.]|jgi:23S rRNA pseudouridine955/2504/2580 synthase
MKTFIIKENDQGQRLDKFLSKSVPLLPKSLLYKSIRKKRIKVNGKKCELNYKLCLGDQLDLYLNDEFFPVQESLPFLAVPSKIDVVYEDEQILLVNKPQGLVVHEDNDNTLDTLIHRVQHYLYDQGEYHPEDELSFAPALCNRIDRNTCGMVIVAKTAAALRILNEKIKNREITKKYLCLVAGTPSPKQATLTHYLQKDSSKNQVTLYDKPRPNAKTAITQYQVLESRGNLSLVEVNLKTGRTHQIRAHMAYIGHPLLGDGKYGLHALNNQYGIRHQALCSYKLRFDFPTDAGVLNYLKGREFSIQNIWFVDQFHSLSDSH